MREIAPTEDHNYVAFFLTLACNLKCPYCINLHQLNYRHGQLRIKNLTVDEWIEAANRLVLRDDLPLTLQGGEPTLYKGFYRFVNEVSERIKMDLLTNMKFDVKEFIKSVPVWRFTREAPYAPIRVSYHPGQNDIQELIDKTLTMQEAGFRVGIYGINHPDDELRAHILSTQEQCINLGIDFRIKEFLGYHNGRLYGTYKYDDCINSGHYKRCECRTTEIIVGPQGFVYRCHSDLYNGRAPIAHISDPNFGVYTLNNFRHCEYYGNCNPCDVKVKTNRFQIFGHTSVEIINLLDRQNQS